MRPKAISASQAKGYYYEKDSIFASKGDGENSFWHGKGSEILGLSGKIQEADFVNALAGCDKEGNQLVKDGPNGNHENNIDLTFDAPKTASIIALHLGDQRIIDAHLESVKAAQNFIQNEYSYVRQTIDGKTEAVKQDNLIFANFTHSTSRENDPQLHTHGIIMNNVGTENGHRALKNNMIYEDQKIIRSVYLSDFAKRVTELGYRLEHGKNGEWEIAGVSKEAVQSFSKRDEGLKQYWEEHKDELRLKYPNATDAKLMDIARIDSRPSKEIIDQDILKDKWEKEYSRNEIQKGLDAAKSLQVEKAHLSPDKLINISYEAIHERESTFTRQEVIDGAMRLSRGVYTYSDLDKAFAENRDIVHIGEKEIKNGQDKTPVIREVYSSKDMIETEKGIVRDFFEGKGKVEGFMSREASIKAIEALNKESDFSLNRGQLDAASLILSGKDRFSVIQGDAGSGKTLSMKAVFEVLQEGSPDAVIRGLGFTGKSAHELELASGIKSDTIHGFLGKGVEAGAGKELWIVDESSMVSSRQMAQLIDSAKETDARVVFLGDAKQLQSIQAGKMFKDLQEKGLVEKTVMDTAIRQKTEHLKEAVYHIKSYQEGRDSQGMAKAFSVLKDSDIGVFADKSRRDQTFERPEGVREIGLKDNLVNAVVKDFSSLDEWKSSAVLTATNSIRKDVNQGIHEAFKEKGLISEDGNIYNVRSVVSFADEHARLFAANYEVGQNVFVSEKIGGLKTGSEWTIAGRDTYFNKIEIENRDNVRVEIDLMRDGNKLSVYQEDRREFSVGDKVVFGKNDRKLGINNGSTGIIEKADEKGILSVKIDGSGKTAEFNTGNYSYVDYGYALTLHKAQGMSYDKVLYLTDTRNEEMNKSESFYVAVSRAREDVVIYTDNAERLEKQVSQAQEKTSTLDHTLDRDSKGFDFGKDVSASKGSPEAGKEIHSKGIELEM